MLACLAVTAADVVELGVNTPHVTKKNELTTGEVGYLCASIKKIEDVKVGDVIVFKLDKESIMIDIRNKEIRKSLIAKYLDAETSFAEERMLVDYFLSHKDVDEDEQAFVKMIRMENIQTNLLSDKGVEEYDRIVSETKQESKRIPLRRMMTGRSLPLTSISVSRVCGKGFTAILLPLLLPFIFLLLFGISVCIMQDIFLYIYRKIHF